MEWRIHKVTFKEWIFAVVAFVIFYFFINIINEKPITLELKEIVVDGHSSTN